MTAINQLTHIQTSELRHFWPSFPPKQASRYPQIPQPPTLCCEEPSTRRIEGPSAVLLTAWKLSCEKNCSFHLLNQLCIAKASCFQVFCGLFPFGCVSSSCLSCLLCSCSSGYLGFRGSLKTGQVLFLPPFTTHPTSPRELQGVGEGATGVRIMRVHICAVFIRTCWDECVFPPRFYAANIRTMCRTQPPTSWSHSHLLFEHQLNMLKADILSFLLRFPKRDGELKVSVLLHREALLPAPDHCWDSWQSYTTT